MKIFKVSDYDWIAAASLEEAIAYCKSDLDYDEDSIDDPYEVVEAHWDSLYVSDNDVDPDKVVGQVTFRVWLQRMLDRGEKFPTMFCSTEY